MISKKGEKRPQLPSGEPLIVVDLNSRKIDTAKQLALPQFHNMQADICAETIYYSLCILLLFVVGLFCILDEINDKLHGR